VALRYRPELDGLRAIAIFAVMGFHFARPLATGGSFGVDIFFVLSGYLITSILLGQAEEGGIRYGAFLARRARRLLPALFLLLAVYVALGPILWPQFANRRWLDAATAAFYVTNLRETFWPADTPLSHTWSLAIEEQFYIGWPLVIGLLSRLSRRRAVQLLVAAWAVLTVARWGWETAWPAHASAYYFTPLHATGLLLGSALAFRPWPIRWGGGALAALGLLIVAGHSTQGFVLQTPVAELLAALVLTDPPRLLAAAPLRFVGRISYGAYLWHIPIAWAFDFPANFVAAAGLMALSLAAGAVSHYGLERWFLAGRSGRPAPAGAPA